MFERQKQDLITKWRHIDRRVIDAFLSVPRELFVPEGLKEHAYEDHPLPIPDGQTISQPSTVVEMLDALNVLPGHNVLEIGTGSGYNAALLSRLVEGTVTSLEISPLLVRFARENLAKAGIGNVDVVLADGALGYPKNAPYDRIVGTCAAPMIPEPWVKQLRDKGVILAPVGGISQRMMRIAKHGDELDTRFLGEYSFVPLRK